MARGSKPPAEEERPQLLVTHAEATTKLTAQVDKGATMQQLAISNWEQLKSAQQEFHTWDEYNAELLGRIFTTQRIQKEYSSWGAFIVAGQRSLYEEVEEFRQDVGNKIRRLRSVIERLELMPLSSSVETLPLTQSELSAPKLPSRIFLVHGHDEAVRETVARYVERLGLHVVILHEQPHRGQTVLEKLEHNGDVDFAVVLLTPDDVGASAMSATQLQNRARQNVVLELGYFVGRIGRSRVCAVYKPTLELPSDILGVAYIEYDRNGGWRLNLAKELRAAGFAIDLNLAVS